MKGIEKAAVLLSTALAILATTGVASAGEAAETNVKERVECLFRVYISEGGEQGLDCLV
jgi:hypothetical protein